MVTVEKDSAAERESGNMDKDKTWAELLAANSRRRRYQPRSGRRVARDIL
jgi:hypothetical protein